MISPSAFARGLLLAGLHFLADVLKALHCFRLGESVYLKGIQIFPTEQGAFLNGLANLFDRSGDFDRARSAYERAISLEPTRSHHYWALGALMEKKGEPQLAVEHYQAALTNGQKYSPEFRRLLEKRIADLRGAPPALQ